MVRKHTIICDECMAVQALTDNNMKTVPIDEEDYDYCPECIDSVLYQIKTAKGDL